MTHRGPDRARRLLIIPDAHASPAYGSDRFAWLGRMIAAERPDVIVCLGDFADMPSLSAYDKGKRGFEGRRYVNDVAATREALSVMHAEFDCRPEMILTLGNHEFRVDRATSDASELDGTLSIDDLGFREHGWQLVPYQSTALVAGFACSHHFASGVAGRPIGGVNAAASMTRLLFTSAIVGHSHVADYARRTRPDGSHVLGIVAGCYVAPDHSEGWSAASEHLWWRGCLVLEDAHNGDAGEIRWVSQERMRALYGGAVQPAPPSMTTGRAPEVDTPRQPPPPAVDVSDLDLDDVPETSITRPDDDAPHRTWARYLGVDESTIRKWRRDGLPPSVWRRKGVA